MTNNGSNQPRVALISGITGQDGSYLAELLLEKGYVVHGIKRRASSFNTTRIDHLYQDPHERDRTLFLHYGDLTDSSNLIKIIQKIQPDEIYNLGPKATWLSASKRRNTPPMPMPSAPCGSWKLSGFSG